jgi:AcrR family transcriptional regulator
MAGETGGRRREQILLAALQLFRNRGFDRTSLREIAEALDLSKSGLYHHFSAKDSLIVALVEPLLEDVEGLLARAPRELTTLEARRKFLKEYLEILIAHRDVTSLLGNDVGVLSHPRIGRRVSDINEHLHLRLAGPAPDIATRIRVTHALVGLQAVVVRLPEIDPHALRTIALRAAGASLTS